MLNKAALDASLAAGPGDLAAQLRTYIGEAEFFAGVLEPNVASLPPGGKLIEIGSGIGLLSLMMAERGFEVLAIEPESAGFGTMTEMRGVVLEHWDGPTEGVTWVNTDLETASVEPEQHADFAYAVNVVEHIPATTDLVRGVIEVLAEGGSFRFICPNYAFPYEPHFEIPTLVSKRLTERVFGSAIRNSALSDPQEMWDELSWPMTHRLRRSFREVGLDHEFSTDATLEYLTRATDDAAFGDRKGRTATAIFKAGAATLPRFIGVVPTALLPVIDCTVRR